jgi:hypothetical protein
MPSKACKVERLSPDHWEKIPPLVDQDLWKTYMNENDSDSDISDSEQEDEMPGPVNDPKTTKLDGPEAKPISKNDTVSYFSLSHDINSHIIS